MLRLTGLLLLASLPALAKPTVIYLEWREFQKMADLIQFRPKVTVFTGEHGQERIRGKFTGIYDSGIAFAKKGTRQPLIKREDVHSVRMSPRRGNPQKWRVIAGIAAFPLWFVGINLGLAIPGGIPEGRWYKNRHLPQGLLVGFGMPAAVWMLAQRADRRGGSIIVKLEKRRENPK